MRTRVGSVPTLTHRVPYTFRLAVHYTSFPGRPHRNTVGEDGPRGITADAIDQATVAFEDGIRAARWTRPIAETRGIALCAEGLKTSSPYCLQCAGTR